MVTKSYIGGPDKKKMDANRALGTFNIVKKKFKDRFILLHM